MAHAKQSENKTYKHRVSDKEDGSVVTNKVPVPFVCVKLYSEPSRISGSVS